MRTVQKDARGNEVYYGTKSSEILCKNISYTDDLVVCLISLLWKKHAYEITLLSVSLTLRVERRLRVFENKVLRKIFGPKRNEVTGG
jgi:hypothetical protein